MAYISVFDVLGPNMIGPSSSHTAGAAAIALLAQKMIAPPIVRAEFTLYGSFSKTYQGHGTDRGTPSGWPGSGGWPTPSPPARRRRGCTPTRWTSVWKTPPAG